MHFLKKSKCQCKIKQLDFVQVIKILSYSFNLVERNVSCDQCLLDQYYTSVLYEEMYKRQSVTTHGVSLFLPKGLWC